MAVRPTPSSIGRFVLADRVLHGCMEGGEDESRVTQGVSACGVGDSDELPRVARVPLTVQTRDIQPTTKETRTCRKRAFPGWLYYHRTSLQLWGWMGP